VREPAEEPQLDEPRLARVENGQLPERFVQIDEVDGLGRRGHLPLDQRHAQRASALGRLPRPGVVDQDPPHQPRGHREELVAILPMSRLSDDAEVRLVREIGRRQRVGTPLLLQKRRGSAPELGIEKRHHRVARRFIPTAPGLKQPRQLTG
jgi:hypothetical protein